MSKPNRWTAFDKLVSSPLLSTRNINGRKRQRRKSPKRSLCISKHVRDKGIPNDDLLIEVLSEEEQDPVVKPSTKLQEVAPAPREERSVSDLENVSEGSPAILNETSDSSSTDDDCLAITCRESKMTRLSFKAKQDQKRPRITDEDLNTSFISTVISPTKNQVQTSCQSEQAESPANTDVLRSSSLNASRWNQLETSITETDLWNIEDVSSSSEKERECEDQADGIIENYTPSPVGNSSVTSRQDAATSFFVISPKEEKQRHRTSNQPAGSIISRLESALREKKSRHNIWNHEMSCGAVRPSVVAKVESIDRAYGRVMLHFHTPAETGSPQDLIENIICVDPSDRSLKQLQAGMEIAFDIDDQIAPLRISRNRLVHLGNTKFSLVRTPAPDNKQKQ
uniref:Uncharacterized protein n=2 Tax=Anopheles albimanus TaxID=7167 RepID=A0A8W7K5H1_ANOAL